MRPPGLLSCDNPMSSSACSVDRGDRAPGRRGATGVDGEVAHGGNVLPSPTSIRIPALVLTPNPGIDMRPFERGRSSRSVSIRPASSLDHDGAGAPTLLVQTRILPEVLRLPTGYA